MRETPILKNVPGEQSGEGGEHLKVDIAKASVTVTNSTYTGSRIDPPISAFTGFKGQARGRKALYNIVVEKRVTAMAQVPDSWAGS